MSPEVFRAWVTIVMRDIVTPLAGIYLTIWLAQHELFAYWQVPLLAGMMLVPLVAHGTNGDDGE